MRHLLLALLVALLPLRGWVGDAMATGLLAQQVAAAQHAAETSDVTPATGALAHQKQPPAAECPGHPAATDGSDSTQHNCTACNICHALAFVPVVAMPLPDVIPAAVPHPGTRAFSSAEAAASFKPPIS